jgi:hypothetical protein
MHAYYLLLNLCINVFVKISQIKNYWWGKQEFNKDPTDSIQKSSFKSIDISR